MSDAEKALPLGSNMAELCDIMERLLSPDGCPWDREQTIETLQPYLLEEAYEVLEAMERDSLDEHREELGDLLLQIVFQSALRQREGWFDIDDVIAGIVDKLVRRHPHVFGESLVETPEEVHAQWDRIKAEEKRARKRNRQDNGQDNLSARTLSGVPKVLPALLRAQQLTMRAARVGFDWPDVSGTWDKLNEEQAELQGAAAEGARAPMEAELGDLLFTTVNLARKLGIDAEGALRGANQRFEARFEHIEDRLSERGTSPSDASLEEMDQLWNEAKGLTLRRDPG